MKHLKTNEQYFNPNDKIKWNYYKNKFFVSKGSREKEIYIILVDELISWELNYRPIGTYFKLNNRNYTIMDNEIFCGAWGESYSKRELDNIDFMTASELYEKYPKICYNLYYRVSKDSNRTDNFADWYRSTLVKSKFELESIENEKFKEDMQEIKMKIDTEKYNL